MSRGGRTGALVLATAAGLAAAWLLRTRAGAVALDEPLIGPAPPAPRRASSVHRLGRRISPRGATAVGAVAGGWIVAAIALWRTSVPAIRLPHLDPANDFSAPHIAAAAHYARVGYATTVGATVALLAVLAVYAVLGPRLARHSAAGPIGTGMYLAMMGFALVWLAQVPFGLVQLWWERRHHVTHVGYAAWIVNGWLGLGGQFVAVCLSMLIAMGLARRFPRRWWLPAWPAFVGLMALLVFLLPYITPDVHGVRAGLSARAAAIASAEGVHGVPVRVQDVDAYTNAPNAEAVGLGPSRTVIVWNTLLDGRFDAREVDWVLAHEYGHQAHLHLWKDVGWYALLALPGLFLLAAATRRRGGLATPAAVPLLLLVLTLLELGAQPFENLVSRRYEAEADWAALQTLRDPQAARTGLVKLGRSDLAEVQEPRLAYVMLATHPTIEERLAMVEAWRRTQRAR